jgi:sphingolipid C9-methyltransferase
MCTQVETTSTNGSYRPLMYDSLMHILSCRFLGPRMVYTSGIMTSLTEPQTLEQLQDNKLAIVCEKLNLQPTDRLLDIGCGWGTLAAFAHKNYGCEVTGITLGKNQTKFGNERIRSNGGDPERARILCLDYRAIPGGPGHYTKIVSLEMAEVGCLHLLPLLVYISS